MTSTSQLESECHRHLDKYFNAYPNPALQARCLKVLRFLRVSDKPLAGKAEGWAAGVIYAVATTGRHGCGVPGVLNSEFEAVMKVSMGTIRKRAAQIELLMAV